MFCECGCGQVAPIARQSDTKKGYQRGQPKRFIQGHGGALNRKHGGLVGGRASAEYRAWKLMKRRCENPRCADYPDYGGRGIAVCEEWRHDFAAFLADMGLKPSQQHSIDRLDNDRGYEPVNCRWATKKEQVENRSVAIKLTVKGETRSLKDWADMARVSYRTLYQRIRMGISPERAVTMSLGGSPGRKGSTHNQAKLVEADVYAIRRRVASGEDRGLIAQQYAVTRSNIDRIARRRTWSHLTDAEHADPAWAVR
jgi:hypothetical protein